MLRRLRDESGIALVLALMTMTVLTIVATTSIYYATSGQHQSSYTKASDSAYRLAESGINNAMATLGYNQTNALSTSALPNSEGTSSSQTYTSGTAKWWGTLNTSTKIWTIYGKGIVTSPIANTSAVTRLLTATMQVSYSYNQPVNAQAWNYIYLTNTGGANVCDVTLLQNVHLDAPLYIDGNLCFQNNSSVEEDMITPRIPITVVVKGKVAWAANASSIGVSSSNTVTGVYIAGGCGSSLSNTHSPCTPAYPGGGADPIYAGSGGFSTTTPAVGAPVVNWVTDGWYGNASPGPAHPCTTISGTPPSFDGGPSPNDTTQNLTSPYANGSLPTTQNLTPSTADYTCKTSAGELSWNHTTHTMTVNGVVYIDGNVSIGDGSIDEYNGQATLYASGYITVNGTMCGMRNAGNTACDFTNWNPNTEMWILAAHGNNGSGYSVVFPNNATFEGGIYATNSIDLSNNGTIEGPIIGGSATFSQNVTEKPFPVITSVPLGAPGNPNVYAQPNPPGGYSG
ncbi:MAG TPA: pilus assembly PilX N-terminal domain-containing protein [Gaiellaceae bacterium]|nr:pilus assembly PilX N-terminal domain-containing protein [Gaiellaceae bacterium]